MDVPVGAEILSEVHADLCKLSEASGGLILSLPSPDSLGAKLVAQDTDGDLILDRIPLRIEVLQLRYTPATPLETVGLQVELVF